MPGAAARRLGEALRSSAGEGSYARLPEAFHARLSPTPVAAPSSLRVNDDLAAELGLDPEFLRSPEGTAILAGNRVPEGAEPLAMAYAGHQFGNWVPSLGDGRAILLGEVIDACGVRRDLQLKGAGPTPFSRGGDGRAALGPVLREYVVSEAMHGLGVPTTRALAMVATGEPVRRERPLPGAVLTRVATAHLRVGSFQYFYAREDREALRTLADFAVARLFPEAAGAPCPARALLDAVIERQARLIVHWLCVGFIHGVMNTDNVSLAGETLDYGPCAFLDAYHPSTVYSSIDHGGRYAFDQQARIGHWNLTRLAEALLPLLAEDDEEAVAIAQEALGAYPTRFEAHYRAAVCAKLGLTQASDEDMDLAGALLTHMAEQRADFTNTFRALADAHLDAPDGLAPARAEFAEPAAFDTWAEAWRARLAARGSDEAERRRSMRAVNPAYIPRNHRVEQAITAAEAGDLAPLSTLLEVTTRPYEDHPEQLAYRRPPEPHEVVRQTFCGT